MDKFFDFFLGQLLALLTFFAFPAVQYLLLKRFTAREGAPQLWYLPPYGFRVVIRNLPGKRPLASIRYRALLRKEVPPTSGTTSPTFVDDLLHQREDFFLFPGVDQVLLAFTLAARSDEEIEFVSTDLLGKERRRVPLTSFDRVVCDYEATVKNWFNFDVRIAKRVTIGTASLHKAWSSLQSTKEDQQFPLDEVVNVG